MSKPARAAVTVTRLRTPAGDHVPLLDAGAWTPGYPEARRLAKLAARQAEADRGGRETPVWLSGPLAGQTRVGGYTVRGWVIAVGGVLNAPVWLLAEVEQSYLAARAVGTQRAAA